MNDTQLRMYCFEQAKAVLGSTSVGELLEAAETIYAFLTAASEPTKH